MTSPAPEDSTGSHRRAYRHRRGHTPLATFAADGTARNAAYVKIGRIDTHRGTVSVGDRAVASFANGTVRRGTLRLGSYQQRPHRLNLLDNRPTLIAYIKGCGVFTMEGTPVGWMEKPCTHRKQQMMAVYLFVFAPHKIGLR